MTATRHPGRDGQLRTWARRWSTACSITLVVAGAPAAAVRAASFSGGFAAGPVGAGVSGYFSLALRPGTTLVRTLQISNLRPTTQTLDLYAVQGVTSPSSGDVYVGRPGICKAAGCWITGLPPRVTLAANQARQVAFSVHVPATTPPGQYLAGVAVQPASRPAPTSGRGAEAMILHEVVTGVAVTAGSHYRSALSVPTVSGAAIGDAAGVTVAEANGGAQFEHPSGTVTLVANGANRSFPLRSSTVLPGGRATLRVLTPQVTPGAHSARVALTYDGGAKTAYWTGTVRIPAVQPVATQPAGPGSPTPAAPARASGPSVLLLMGTGVGGALLAALTVSLYRRRRGHPAAPQG